MKKEFIDWLETKGVTNPKYYMLINNYGYTFDYKGKHYDLRHWLNCYGADVDYWSLDDKVGALSDVFDAFLKYDETGNWL